MSRQMIERRPGPTWSPLDAASGGTQIGPRRQALRVLAEQGRVLIEEFTQSWRAR